MSSWARDRVFCSLDVDETASEILSEMEAVLI